MQSYCNKKQNYTNSPCNFSGIPEKLAQSIPDKFLKNKNVHSFCEMAEKNASLFDVSFALIMGTTLGAGGILASPFNKKEDKQYMASQLIMNCLVSFALSLVVYLPLSKSMAKLGQSALKQASKSNSFPYKAGSKEYDSFNYLVNYGSRFIIAPIQSFLIIKGITPLFENIFQTDAAKNTKKQGGEA
jgi:hypothetical protein